MSKVADLAALAAIFQPWSSSRYLSIYNPGLCATSTNTHYITLLESQSPTYTFQIDFGAPSPSLLDISHSDGLASTLTAPGLCSAAKWA